MSSGIDWRRDTPSRTRAPAVTMTGLGYEYVRCQRGNHDDTVYIHQLCAIAGGADPHKVFHPNTEVHHICPIPWLNTPENVECVTSWEHPTQPTEDEPRLSKEVFTYDEGPEESTVHGVPESEYERLEAAEVDDARSEVSNNLRKQMREYRDRDLRDGGSDE